MADEIDIQQLEAKFLNVQSQKTWVLQMTLEYLASSHRKKTWIRLDREKVKTAAAEVAGMMADDLIGGNATESDEWKEQIRASFRKAAAALSTDEAFDWSVRVLTRNDRIKFVERHGHTCYRPKCGPGR